MCFGDCFNSSKSRTVICIKNEGFAEESECDISNKPLTFEDCKPEDMENCRPRWHISEWNEVIFLNMKFSISYRNKRLYVINLCNT